MPLLFIRYFQLFGPICWMWTLSLIATEVRVCYICSYHVAQAQKADRYLVILGSWEFFSPSPQLFSSSMPPWQTPQLHSHLSDGMPSQSMPLLFAPIELISAFWTEMMPSPQYVKTCSAVFGRVIQPGVCPVHSGGCRLHFSSLQSLLHANQERLHSIQSSFSPAVVQFYNLLSYLLSPVCLGWEGGRSSSQIRAQAITCYIWPGVETDVCERSLPG